MSWLCSIDESGAALVVGDEVEEIRGGVFEGVWDGLFDLREPQRAEHYFGSGVIGNSGELLILTPKHTLEGVFSVEDKRTRRLYFSNSLACVCCVADISVSEEMRSRALQVKRGFYGYDSRLLENDEIALDKLVFYDYLIRRDGMAYRMPLPELKQFDDYAHYRSSVASVINVIAANALHTGRRQTYEPLAAVSAGYDSPACAALAKAAGCERAITTRTGRRGGVDSGRQVARALGLSLVERDRPPFHEREDAAMGETLADLTDPDHFDLAAEFLATGMIGHEANFVPFADVLPGTLLITGFQGGRYWDISEPPSRDAERMDSSGSSMFEFRSRLGFVHFPVPFIFVRSQEDVRTIGLSDEMKPYSIGGAYNRPVARRLAEDAGVPRTAFGQHNNASSVLFFPQKRKRLFPRSVEFVSRRYLPAQQVLAARRRRTSGSPRR
ncbi:MAG: hypothetical protein K0S15_1888 [Solirubrobacterales bacterium]|jgi:hypothetical protein|nr:hypothetical protein [Solirubrobacterales bacterium]